LISPVFGFVSVELEGRLSARSVFTDSYVTLWRRLRRSRNFFFDPGRDASPIDLRCNPLGPVA